MNKLHNEMIIKLITYIKNNFNKETIYIGLPEYSIAPDKLKHNYYIDSYNIEKIENLLKNKANTSNTDFIHYITRLYIIEENNTGEFNINHNKQIDYIHFVYDLIKPYLNGLQEQILDTQLEIEENLIKYGISKELAVTLDNTDITQTSKINLTNLYNKYKSQKSDFEKLLLQCEKMVSYFQKSIIADNPVLSFDKAYSRKSVMAYYIDYLSGKKSKLSSIYENPVENEVSEISKSYIEKNFEHNDKYKPSFVNIIRYPLRLIKKGYKSIKIFLLKVIAETYIFFNKSKDLSLESIRSLSILKEEINHLRLTYSELDKHSPLYINSKQVNNRKDYRLKEASIGYSLSVQDKSLIEYAENPPLSFNIKTYKGNKKFSLLNGVSLIFFTILLFTIITNIVINLSRHKTELFRITEMVQVDGVKPEIYGMNNNNSSSVNGMVLSSIFNDDNDVDKRFLSDIKLTTSTGMEKQKDIRYNIIQKIRENEENRKQISFDEDLQSIRDDLYSETNNENDITQNEENENSSTNDVDNETNEALNIDQPLSLPDYSKRTLDIFPHDLDFTLENKTYTIEDFKPSIVNLQNRLDDWYNQTVVFFDKYEDSYKITIEHQKMFLTFIKDLDPVKIFEAFNYQYQNFPYLLDRIIKDEMPVIYTAISADARELGLWSSEGIGIFYDISSFDIFRQVFLHELTHDLVERAYGTPIILEGITEMLAMNISGYIFGEGFTNYKGPVRVAQFLYNRNPKALLDYYMGRTVDKDGLSVDLFDKDYITRNFLNPEVSEEVINKNTKFINSLLDINFTDFITTNRRVIPLNEIINTHTEYTPLVLQADFNYKGYENQLLDTNTTIINIQDLILRRLGEYVKDRKKVDFYTLLTIGKTFKLLNEAENLTDKQREILSKIKKQFHDLQDEILENNLLYKQNELSEKSKEIFEDSHEPTFSDKEHNQEIEEYKEGTENGLDNPVNPEFKDNLSNDESEFIESEKKKQLNEHLQDGESSYREDTGDFSNNNNFNNQDLNNISEEEMDKITGEALRYDLNKFSQTINDSYVTTEEIKQLYNELLKKWGPRIKELLDEQMKNLVDYPNRFKLEDLSGLPNDLELLKKRFELMEKAVIEDDTSNPYYYDVEDDIWFRILSLIDEKDYTIRYYELLVEKLFSSYYAVDIRITLSNMKRIASYINTTEFLEKYRDDLKRIIESVKTSETGIKKLDELNTHLKGNLHPYVKSEILRYLENFILDYINNYPESRFGEIFNSTIIDKLKSPELYDVLKKAINSGLLITQVNDNLILHEDIYSKVNIKGLAEDYLRLYTKQIKSIVKDSRHAVYLNVIFNTEKLLLQSFGQNRKSFLDTEIMKGFYLVSYDVLLWISGDFPEKENLMPYIQNLNEREKYMALFNISISQSKYAQMSFNNFYRIYRDVFLKQLNLYSNYSDDFLGFLINIGFKSTYSNNLYNLMENSFDKYIDDESIFNPLMTLPDYIAKLDDNRVKLLLSSYLVDFLEYYLNYNYFDQTNVYFVLLSSLGKYISKNAYIKLIQIRYLYQTPAFKDIPFETELLYIIMNMMINYPLIIDDGIDNNTKSIISNINNTVNPDSKTDYEELITLFITQVEKTGILSFKASGGAFLPNKPYQKSKILYYQSNIVGMMVYVYEKLQGPDDGIKVISHLLSIMGLYLYEYGQELTFYGKNGLSGSSFSMGEVLRNRYKENPYRPINILKRNPDLFSKVEQAILDNVLEDRLSTFNTFFLLAFEEWFWHYFTRNANEKDEAVLIISEDPSYYEETFNDGFVSDYFDDILFNTKSDSDYMDVKHELLVIRDYLLPFIINKEEEFLNLFDKALKLEDSDGATFLFRLICGNYLAIGNLYIDFFIEGELTRRFFRKFILENEENYDKLYFLLPFKPVKYFSYEEELRRNMINIHYHIFQSLPQDNKYLYDLLEIYKSTLSELMNDEPDDYYSIKDRIEEEFSKVANLVYLVEDENLKYITAEKVYPLVEKYVKDRGDDSAYLFANYVRKNVNKKSSQLKWNILDSIKSFAFNYKNEVDRLYRNLFEDLSTDLLISYKDYLTDLINTGYEVPPTEYKVLLEIVSEKDSLEAKQGINVMKNAYDKAYEEAKKSSFAYNDYDDNIKYIISNLKNLISYSSNPNDLTEIKKNITNYSKQVSSVFRDLAKSYSDDKQIRLLVSEMAKEIIRLPIQDKFGLFSIFSNVITNYEAINNPEYKYYTTLLEYLIPDIFNDIDADKYSDFSDIMENIAMLIIYLDDVLDKYNRYNYDFPYTTMTKKFQSLLILYSHYISLVGVSGDAKPLNEYILSIYSKTNNKLAREEEAIIASNLLSLKNYNARIYVNEYLRAPLFRRYLEELSDLDRSTIIKKTQNYINWLSETKTDYDYPSGNRYLLDILGIEGYLNELRKKQYNNFEITNEIYKWRNNMVSRLTGFFTETYGYPFVDPQKQYTPSF